MFSFPVVKSSFCFTNINIIAVPAASFVNDFRSLRTIKAVFVRKEGFDAACVLQDDLEVDERIEVGYTGFQTFSDLECWGDLSRVTGL